jgi:hypothetical protein
MGISAGDMLIHIVRKTSIRVPGSQDFLCQPDWELRAWDDRHRGKTAGTGRV